MLVSIIINNYNYGRFVGQAIQSALDQTHLDIEIIVVDDGSTDDSRAIIESFGSKVRALFKENGGQGSAYNAGFAASRGELIHFLDADDILEPTAIEEVVKAWEPGVAKIQFYLQVVEGIEAIPTSALIPCGKLPSGDVRPGLLSSGNYHSPPASGNAYLRDVLSKILPMPASQWITAADMYTIYHSALAGEVRSISRPLGLYRVHGDNMDAQTLITGKLLRYRLTKETRRDKLLADYCRAHDFAYAPGSVSKDIGNAKIRMASLLVDKDKHPYKKDTVFSVLAKCVKLCLANESFSASKKVLFCGWLFAVVACPKRTLSALLTLGFFPAKRPKVLQKFLAHTNVPARAVEDALEAARRPERRALAETHQSSLQKLSGVVTGRQQLTYLNDLAALRTAMPDVEPSQPTADNSAEVIQ
jgi:glycosyltransferase involved in cell wall biosynthesis